MGLELFADCPSCVTTGSAGTTAPSQGTSESWTSMGTGYTSFPTASNSNVPATYFYIRDPADSTNEICQVTNVSGSTWTVTRGADGSTPVAHATGATWVQVVAAGTLQNFKQASNASTSPVTVNTTGEQVLATYTPLSTEIQAGVTFEAIAFGSIEKLGSTGTFTFRLRWGGLSGTLLTSHVTGTGSLNITTLASGSSFDVNGTVTLIDSTHAVANLNYFASAVSGTVSAQGCASTGSSVAISGGGPLVLTVQLSTTLNSNSLTVPAPLIYRAA